MRKSGIVTNAPSSYRTAVVIDCASGGAIVVPTAVGFDRAMFFGVPGENSRRLYLRGDASLCSMPISWACCYFAAVLSHSRNRFNFDATGLSCGVTK